MCQSIITSSIFRSTFYVDLHGLDLDHGFGPLHKNI
jgi:hypothetical protein